MRQIKKKQQKKEWKLLRALFFGLIGRLLLLMVASVLPVVGSASAKRLFAAKIPANTPRLTEAVYKYEKTTGSSRNVLYRSAWNGFIYIYSPLLQSSQKRRFKKQNKKKLG